MTNVEASDVLREYIRINKPCNGLEMALQKAITALEHQPEPFRGFTQQQCNDCGDIRIELNATTCGNCGSSDLRPIRYVSEIGRKA